LVVDGTLDTYEMVHVLRVAIKKNHFDICKLFINRGADVNEAFKEDDADIYDTICYAASFGNNDICNLLLDHGATFEDEEPSPLASAAQNGHISTAQLLIDRGVLSTTRDDFSCELRRCFSTEPNGDVHIFDWSWN